MIHGPAVSFETDAQVGTTTPLSAWLRAIMDADPTRHASVASLLWQDWHKIERLQALHRCMGLPIHDYLRLESTTFRPDAADIQCYFARHQKASFALRAFPQQTYEQPLRALGLTREACLASIDNIRSSKTAYQIYLWDYLPSEWCGTILVTAQGLYAEMVRGSHLLITQQAVKVSELFTARLLFPTRHMVYSTNEVHVRTILWRAISALRLECDTPFSSFALPPLLQGYVEFSYHSTDGYRFFDYNNHLFIARLPLSTLLPDVWE